MTILREPVSVGTLFGVNVRAVATAFFIKSDFLIKITLWNNGGNINFRFLKLCFDLIRSNNVSKDWKTHFYSTRWIFYRKNKFGLFFF